MQQIPLKIQLDDSATFENFFVARNALLINSNQQVVERLSKLHCCKEEFIYIWGAKDSGKTHLAQAVCCNFNLLDFSAAYLPLSDTRLSPEILAGMNCMDLVCIDDLDMIEGNHEWEVALFDLYNNLKLEKKSLIILANKTPLSSEILLPDLKSRVSAMEVYKLESLDDEAKAELFKARAERRGLDIPIDVIKFIISRKSRSISGLMGVLEKIDHSSMALKRKVTIPLVKALFDL